VHCIEVRLEGKLKINVKRTARYFVHTQKQIEILSHTNEILKFKMMSSRRNTQKVKIIK